MWVLQACIIVSFNRFGSEYTFIKENNSESLTFELSNSEFYILPPLFILRLLLWIDKLNKLDSLSFDFMKLIEITKESHINAMITEVTMEEETAFLERFGCPTRKIIRTFEKFNVLRT